MVDNQTQTLEQFSEKLNNPNLSLQEKLDLPESASIDEIYARIDEYRLFLQDMRIAPTVFFDLSQKLDDVKIELQQCQQTIAKSTNKITAEKEVYRIVERWLNEPIKELPKQLTSEQVNRFRAIILDENAHPFQRLGLEVKRMYSAEQVRLRYQQLLQEFPVEATTESAYVRGTSQIERLDLRDALQNAYDKALSKTQPKEQILRRYAVRASESERIQQLSIQKREKLIKRLTKNAVTREGTKSRPFKLTGESNEAYMGGGVRGNRNTRPQSNGVARASQPGGAASSASVRPAPAGTPGRVPQPKVQIPPFNVKIDPFSPEMIERLHVNLTNSNSNMPIRTRLLLPSNATPGQIMTRLNGYLEFLASDAASNIKTSIRLNITDELNALKLDIGSGKVKLEKPVLPTRSGGSFVAQSTSGSGPSERVAPATEGTKAPLVTEGTKAPVPTRSSATQPSVPDNPTQEGSTQSTAASEKKKNVRRKKITPEQFRKNLQQSKWTLQKKLGLPANATIEQIKAKINYCKQLFTSQKSAKIPAEIRGAIVQQLDRMKEDLRICETSVRNANQEVEKIRKANGKLKEDLKLKCTKPSVANLRFNSPKPLERLGLNPERVYSTEQIRARTDALLQQFLLEPGKDATYSVGLSVEQRQRNRARFEAACAEASAQTKPKDVLLQEAEERLKTAETAQKEALDQRKKLIGHTTDKAKGTSGNGTEVKSSPKIKGQSTPTEKGSGQAVTEAAPVDEIQERRNRYEIKKQANEIAFGENEKALPEARQKASKIYSELLTQEGELKRLRKIPQSLLKAEERALLETLPKEISSLRASHAATNSEIRELMNKNHDLYQERYALEKERLEIRQAEIEQHEIKTGKRPMPLKQQYGQINELYKSNIELLEKTNRRLMTERRTVSRLLSDVQKLDSEYTKLISKQRTGQFSPSEQRRLSRLPNEIQALETSRKASLEKISNLESDYNRLWSDKAKFDAQYGEIWDRVVENNRLKPGERGMSLAEQRTQIKLQNQFAEQTRKFNTTELSHARGHQGELYKGLVALESRQSSLLEQQALRTLTVAEKMQLESLPERIEAMRGEYAVSGKTVSQLQTNDGALWQEERALSERTRIVRQVEIADNPSRLNQARPVPGEAPRRVSTVSTPGEGSGEAKVRGMEITPQQQARLMEIARERERLRGVISKHTERLTNIYGKIAELDRTANEFYRIERTRELKSSEINKLGEINREIEALTKEKIRVSNACRQGEIIILDLSKEEMRILNPEEAARIKAEAAQNKARGRVRRLRNVRPEIRGIRLSNGKMIIVSEGPLGNALITNNAIISNRYITPKVVPSGKMPKLRWIGGGMLKGAGAGMGGVAILSSSAEILLDRSLTEGDKALKALKTVGYFTPVAPILMIDDMGALYYDISRRSYSEEEAKRAYLAFKQRYGDVFACPDAEQTPAGNESKTSDIKEIKLNDTSPIVANNDDKKMKNPIARRFFLNMANTITKEHTQDNLWEQVCSSFTAKPTPEFYELCDNIQKNPADYFRKGVQDQNLFMTMVAASAAQKKLLEAANERGESALNDPSLDKYKLKTDGLIEIALKNNDVETLYYLLSGFGTQFDKKDIIDILKLPRTLMDNGEDLGEIALVSVLGQLSSADTDKCINSALMSTTRTWRGISPCLTPVRFELLLSQYNAQNKMSSQTCINILNKLKMDSSSSALGDVLLKNGFNNIEVTPEVIRTISKLPEHCCNRFILEIKKSDVMLENPELLDEIKPLNLLSVGKLKDVSQLPAENDTPEMRRSPLRQGHIDWTNDEDFKTKEAFSHPIAIDMHHRWAKDFTGRSELLNSGVNSNNNSLLNKHEFVLEECVYLTQDNYFQLVYKDEEAYRNHQPDRIILCHPKKMRFQNEYSPKRGVPQNMLFHSVFGMDDYAQKELLNRGRTPVSDYLVWNDVTGWEITQKCKEKVRGGVLNDHRHYRNIVIKTEEPIYDGEEVTGYKERHHSEFHRSTDGVTEEEIKSVKHNGYTTYEYPAVEVITPHTFSSEKIYEMYTYDENHQRVYRKLVLTENKKERVPVYERVGYHDSAHRVTYTKNVRREQEQLFNNPLHVDWAREHQLKRMATDKENAFYGAIMANDVSAQDYLLQLDPTLISRPLTYLTNGQKKTGTVLDILGEYALTGRNELKPEQVAILRASVKNAPNRKEMLDEFILKMNSQDKDTDVLMGYINMPAYNGLKYRHFIPSNHELIAEVTSAKKAGLYARDAMMDYVIQSWQDATYIDSVRGKTLMCFMQDLMEKYPETKEEIVKILPEQHFYKEEMKQLLNIETDAVEKNVDMLPMYDELSDDELKRIDAALGNKKLSHTQQLGLSDIASMEDVSRRARTLQAWYQSDEVNLSVEEKEEKIKNICDTRDTIFYTYKKDYFSALALEDKLENTSLEEIPEVSVMYEPKPIDTSFISEGIDLSDRMGETARLMPQPTMPSLELSVPSEITDEPTAIDTSISATLTTETLPPIPDPIIGVTPTPTVTLAPTQTTAPTVIPEKQVKVVKEKMVKGQDKHIYDKTVYDFAKGHLTEWKGKGCKRKQGRYGEDLSQMIKNIELLENKYLLPKGKDNCSNAYIYLYKLQQMNLWVAGDTIVRVKNPKTRKTQKITVAEYLCGDGKKLTPKEIENLLKKETLSQEDITKLKVIATALLRIESSITPKGNCLLNYAGAKIKKGRAPGFKVEKGKDTVETETQIINLHGTQAEQNEQLREWQNKGYSLQSQLQSAQDAGQKVEKVASTQSSASSLRNRLRNVSGEANASDLSEETLITQPTKRVNV